MFIFDDCIVTSEFQAIIHSSNSMCTSFIFVYDTRDAICTVLTIDTIYAFFDLNIYTVSTIDTISAVFTIDTNLTIFTILTCYSHSFYIDIFIKAIRICMCFISCINILFYSQVFTCCIVDCATICNSRYRSWSCSVISYSTTISSCISIKCITRCNFISQCR